MLLIRLLAERTPIEGVFSAPSTPIRKSLSVPFQLSRERAVEAQTSMGLKNNIKSKNRLYSLVSDSINHNEGPMKCSRLQVIIDNQAVHTQRGIAVADPIRTNIDGEQHASKSSDLPLCGIDRCDDCSVTIDGVLGVKACVARVRAGMQIHTQGRTK